MMEKLPWVRAQAQSVAKSGTQETAQEVSAELPEAAVGGMLESHLWHSKRFPKELLLEVLGAASKEVL